MTLGVLLDGEPVLVGQLLDLFPFRRREAQQDLRASLVRAVRAGRRGHALIIDQAPRYLASGAPMLARYRTPASGVTSRTRTLALLQDESTPGRDLGADGRSVLWEGQVGL